MSDPELDATDRQILHELQLDARHNTNAAISDHIGISASTVGKRLTALEASGVITGYIPVVDYELTGLPLRMVFVCTAPITERHRIVEDIADLGGVVDVRELMSGTNNVHVLAVGDSKNAITEIARQIDALGARVSEEVLLRSEHVRPFAQFTEPR